MASDNTPTNNGNIIRVGILGQGRSGFGIHTRWLREATTQFKIVAVADRMPERTQEAANELGARTYREYADLLKDKSLDLDLVVNSLPSDLHPKATLAALNAGHHVLCEKPFATSLKDFDKMVDTARKNKRQLFAFQNSRFQPAFQKIQQIIASGVLGRLVHIRISFSNFARRWDWQAQQQHWGGNLNNTGPHPLDQAVVLFGDKMPHVFAKLASDNPFGDADNFATVTLHGKNSPLVEVVISSFMAYPQGEMYNISGACGGLTGNLSALKWRYFDPKQAPDHGPIGTWSENRKYNSEKLDWKEESWTAAPGDNFQKISQAYYDTLYQSLVHKAKPLVQLPQVRRQIAVIEECHKQNPLPRKRRP